MSTFVFLHGNSFAKSASPLFCICIIANDLRQYAEMRQLPGDVGCTEINRALDEAMEPYVIACHQDILFDPLMSQLELLAQKPMMKLVRASFKARRMIEAVSARARPAKGQPQCV